MITPFVLTMGQTPFVDLNEFECNPCEESDLHTMHIPFECGGD